MVQAFLPNNLPQNTVNYSVFQPCRINGPSLPSKQLAPKHCELQCIPHILHQWPKLSCQTTCPKTLQITVFSTHVEAMVQAFLPNNLPQNTVNYSVFEPCRINGPSLPSKQLAPKHCELQCIPHILHQWPKLSCQTTCPKTLQITVFSTHVEPIVQAFLPNKLLQNIVNSMSRLSHGN